MGYLFKPGKFNDNTWLIDATYKSPEGELTRGGHAAYLIKAENGKNCLVNPGSRSGAPSIYKILTQLNNWPIDMIIITHSHWDHTQGIPFFRKKAEEEKISPVKIMASEKAIPFLNNQSYNKVFLQEEYYSDYLDIPGVSPLKDKEKLVLSDDFSLEILETPGHMEDHISVYDTQNNALFSGDTLGIHWFQDLYICNANSMYWKEEIYLETMEKIKSLDLDYLCIAHFGVFTGEDVSRFIDESVSMYYKWQRFFAQNSKKIEDIPFLLDELWNTIYKDFSNMPVLKAHIEGALINATRYYKYIKQL